VDIEGDTACVGCGVVVGFDIGEVDTREEEIDDVLLNWS
jgi:hypothetical protein